MNTCRICFIYRDVNEIYVRILNDVFDPIETDVPAYISDVVVFICRQQKSTLTIGYPNAQLKRKLEFGSFLMSNQNRSEIELKIPNNPKNKRTAACFLDLEFSR